MLSRRTHWRSYKHDVGGDELLGTEHDRGAIWGRPRPRMSCSAIHRREWSIFIWFEPNPKCIDKVQWNSQLWNFTKTSLVGIALFHAARQIDRWADTTVIILSVFLTSALQKRQENKNTTDAICTVWRTLINVRLSLVNLVTVEVTSRNPSLWLNITYHTPCTGFWLYPLLEVHTEFISQL
jgi:hypothetical protein